MKGRARVHIGALAALLVTATACSASGTAIAPTTTTIQPRATTTSGPAPNTTATTIHEVEDITWTPCGRSGFECATLHVPLDRDEPDGPKIAIALNRRPAADPSRRIGSLVFNPGGPGASGKDLVRALQLPREILDRFDIVGFDPRGVGDSDGLACHSHLQEMYDADPTIDDRTDRDHYIAASKAFVEECADKYRSILPHLGTVEVAEDLDDIRAALGDEQLDYVGYSYGTSIGQQYARLYPERVRTMILDGVVDESVDGLTVLTEQARGFEAALDGYLRDCDAKSCLRAGARATLDRVTTAAEKAPIPSATADRPATPGVVNLAVAYSLYSELLWPSLTSALARADAGDGSELVALADDYLGREGDRYDGSFEIYFAVSCLDSKWPTDPEAYFEAADAAARVAPTFGEATVLDGLRCAYWPTPPQPLPQIPSNIPGLAPVLVISTTGDPATPYENGVRVARRIPGARLLTHRGEGHTVAFEGVSTCVDDVATNYLINAKVPATDITC